MAVLPTSIIHTRARGGALMMALAGAPRATSGGNNSDRPARPAGAGGVALRRRPPGGISSLVELLFAEVVELMAPAVWPAPAAAFVLGESVAGDSRRRWRSGGDRRC